MPDTAGRDCAASALIAKRRRAVRRSARVLGAPPILKLVIVLQQDRIVASGTRQDVLTENLLRHVFSVEAGPGPLPTTAARIFTTCDEGKSGIRLLDCSCLAEEPSASSAIASAGSEALNNRVERPHSRRSWARGR